MHFERWNAFHKQIKFFFFQKKNWLKKICVPTLPKIFRHVSQSGWNILIFLFDLIWIYAKRSGTLLVDLWQILSEKNVYTS